MKRATNANGMKQRNKKLILDLIRREQISRAEIAARVGLTKAAVSIIIEEMIQEGLIAESPAETAGVGRRPILLTLKKNARYAVGIDLTRKAVAVGVINLAGEVLDSESYRGEQMTAAELADYVEQTVDRQLAACGIDKEQVCGFGVTTPGPVDAKGGKILNPPRFAKWHGVRIGALIDERCGLPVTVENVANGRALGEMYFGVAKNASRFLLALVDDGVGSGLVMDGKIYDGVNELGHTSICFDGLPCECGNTGCLERYAAIPAVLAGSGLDSWPEAVDQGWMDVIDREAAYLGTALVNAVNLLDLEMIVLTGEISYQPKLLIEALEARLEKGAIHQKKVPIKSARVASPVVAAGTLALHRFFH